MKIPAPVLGLIEISFNRALALDEDARNRFIALSGKTICMHIQGMDISLYLLPNLDGVQISDTIDDEPDTTIRGGPASLLHTALTHERDRILSGNVVVEGDMELGQKVQNIFKHFDFDWEEALSRITGDVVAHQIGSLVNNVMGWGRYALESLGKDTAEYIQEERRDVAAASEVEEYSTEVDVLRGDVDRIEQRINRLQRAQEDARA